MAATRFLTEVSEPFLTGCDLTIGGKKAVPGHCAVHKNLAANSQDLDFPSRRRDLYDHQETEESRT